MKRIIKFRGKRVDNGEWIYGDLLHVCGACLIYYGSQTDAGDLTSNDDRVAVELLKDEIAVVYSDTVSQFTGLYDKNGKEIYENDILIIPNCYPYYYEENLNHVGIVKHVYTKWQLVFYCINKNVKNTIDGMMEDLYDIYNDERYTHWEIIGNIHDDDKNSLNKKCKTY